MSHPLQAFAGKGLLQTPNADSTGSNRKMLPGESVSEMGLRISFSRQSLDGFKGGGFFVIGGNRGGFLLRVSIVDQDSEDSQEQNQQDEIVVFEDVRVEEADNQGDHQTYFRSAALSKSRD